MSTWWPLLFVLLGVGFAVLGVVLLVRNRRFLARALRVPGVVVDLRARRMGSSGSGGGTVWHPVFRFQTYEGRNVEIVGNLGTDPPPARPGERVTVLYDPANPHNAKLDKPGQSGGFAGWFFIAFGVIFTTVGVVVTTALNA